MKVLVFGIITSVCANQATFWKNENLRGPHLRIINFQIDECVNFYNKWPHEVTWLDTHGICLQVWTKENCQGDVKYFMSNHTNYNKISGMTLKSFRTCETKIKYDQKIVHTALDEGRVEHRFWQTCFRILGKDEQYEKQVRNQGRFIDWNFILHTVEPKKRWKQYDELLDSVHKRFDHFSRCVLNTTNYNLEDFKMIADLAIRVFKTRVTTLSLFPKTDPKYRRHRAIIDKWQKLIGSVKNATHHLEGAIVKEKENLRKSLRNLPACHVLFRIFLPSDRKVHRDKIQAQDV